MSADRTFRCKSHPCCPCPKYPEKFKPCRVTVHDAEDIEPPDTCPWGWSKAEACEFIEEE
ncbi:MAG: hypothetical protein GF414_04425 [Candidatus Altiarchaeales archaeon]|nr:hypothetical protein [Candidatus Altiarchaeales archaeon]